MISNNLDSLISRISSNIMHPTEIFFFIYVIFLGTLAVVTFDKRGRVRKHNFFFTFLVIDSGIHSIKTIWAYA